MNQTMDDLQSNIQRALMNDPRTKDYGVEVLDSNGIITLRGTVPSQAARDTIEEIVKGIHGVISVNNELDVVR
ncbi:MAG TPA: BON domain-containing protein [Anaerolineales bacterium]|nr:BON domain-containing protein [Anaerolineales bacterium]